MRKHLRFIGIVLLLTGFVVPVLGTTRFVIWWHEKAPNRKNVAALDMSTGNVVWQRQLPDVINFVEEQPEGVLVGCDDKNLYLLSLTDGSTVWMLSLGLEVNEYHGAGTEGFFVSHDKAVYWLVGRDGKVVHAWRS